MTAVSPGAAMASGSGVSAAEAFVAASRRRNAVILNDGIAMPPVAFRNYPNRHCEERQRRSNPWCRGRGDGLLRGVYHPARVRATRWLRESGLRRSHRLGQILRDLVEEAGGGQPALVGADQKRKVLGHVAVLHRLDADLFQRGGELRQFVIVVELGTVRQATGPGEDRGDRIGRGLLALLVLAIVPR